MLFKSYCEIASRDIFDMTDELELNWEDPTLYIDGKGRNLYGKKDKLFRKLQNIISETKSKYSDAHLDMQPDVKSIDLHTDRLMEVWTQILNIFAPYREATSRNPMSWWNDHLQQLKDTKEVLSRKKNVPQYAALYKEHINTYNREIELARNAGWQDFCTKTESVKHCTVL